MKIRAADYIAKLLVEKGLPDVFSVVGGGAMHLNDAFGNCQGLNVVYNLHEQGCTMAAEGYARVHGKPATVCVTTGPGGTNAITGVLCAWQDNIPMLVISGQVRYNITVESTGLPLRQFGEQEHYIIDTIKSMTIYAVMIKDLKMIRYHVEKAIYLATEGRMGPCWLDIPLNIQGAIIETNEQIPFVPEKKAPVHIDVKAIFSTLKGASRPVVIAGYAVRKEEIYEEFLNFVRKLKIPVVVGTAISEIFPTNDSLYFGNFGVLGGRAGNFIVQNADCLLVLGCQMAFKHVGYNYEQFSPNSKKIVVDIDNNELKKGLIEIDIPVCIDLKDFFEIMKDQQIETGIESDWLEYCNVLREKYPIYDIKFGESDNVNPYHFLQRMKELLPDNSITVVGNSCACVNMLQLGINKPDQRLWSNVNCATMGYALPASIGAAIASKQEIYCVTGDGSIQMNIQELQTIVTYGLPVKIFLFSNNGYHAIVQTQTNFFGRLSGCTKESGIQFPNFEALSNAYNIPYYRCENNNDVDDIISSVILEKGYCLCEVVDNSKQPIVPKSKGKLLPDGSMYSPPICDMFPFLEENEYKKYYEYDRMLWKNQDE